jgi:chromosome segregation ATPase
VRRQAEEPAAPALDPAELESARRQIAEVQMEREKLSTQLKAIEDAKRAAEGERDRIRIESQVQKLAAKYGVHAEALEDFVELCSSKLTVRDDGSITSRGDKPSSADEFVSAYLKNRPHMLSAKVARGSGASSIPSVSGPVAEVIKIDPKDGASLTRFLAAKGAQKERR